MQMVQPAPQLSVRVTSYLSGSADRALRQGLAQANVVAQADSDGQLTLKRVEHRVFANRLTITVAWAHRPGGQFALLNERNVISQALNQDPQADGYQQDLLLSSQYSAMLRTLGQQIGEELQAYERR